MDAAVLVKGAFAPDRPHDHLVALVLENDTVARLNAEGLTHPLRHRYLPLARDLGLLFHDSLL